MHHLIRPCTQQLDIFAVVAMPVVSVTHCLLNQSKSIGICELFKMQNLILRVDKFTYIYIHTYILHVLYVYTYIHIYSERDTH